jgi:hypothetical protein
VIEDPRINLGADALWRPGATPCPPIQTRVQAERAATLVVDAIDEADRRATAAARTALLADTIGRSRYRYASEDDLQEGLAAALVPAYTVEREVRISDHSRVDLLVDGDLVIEVKVAGTADALLRQVTRYAASPRVAGLVAVTTRVRHLALPDTVGGKPLVTVSLTGSAL